MVAKTPSVVKETPTEVPKEITSRTDSSPSFVAKDKNRNSTGGLFKKNSFVGGSDEKKEVPKEVPREVPVAIVDNNPNSKVDLKPAKTSGSSFFRKSVVDMKKDDLQDQLKKEEKKRQNFGR